MKLKNSQILDLKECLNVLKKIDAKKSAKYIVNSAKMARVLENEIESINEAKPKLKQAHQEKINKVVLSYAEMDGDRVKTYETPTDSNSIEYDNIVMSDDDRIKMQVEIVELEKSRDIEAENAEIAEWKELMNEEVEVDIVPFTEDMVFDGINEEVFGFMTEWGVWVV